MVVLELAMTTGGLMSTRSGVGVFVGVMSSDDEDGLGRKLETVKTSRR
jgi:hypothetical protein